MESMVVNFGESDGTASGTKLAIDIQTGSSSSSPRYLVVYKNKLYFRARYQNYGYELLESDGSLQGTTMVKDINPGPSGSWVFCTYRL